MRVPHAIRLGLTTLLVVMLLGGSASGLSIIFPTISWTVVGQSTDGDTDEVFPTIDGHLIAWQYGNRIRVRNLRTGGLRAIPLSGTGFMQGDPDVSGDFVVYQEFDGTDWNIRRYSWEFNTSTEVVGGSDDETHPRIDGNLVVWYNATDGLIHMRSYDMGGAVNTSVSGGTDYTIYDVDNNRLFMSGNTSPGYEDRVYWRVLAPLTPVAWHSFDFGNGNEIDHLEAHGDRFVVSYTEPGYDQRVYAFDIQSMTATPVTPSTADYAPTIFDKTAAFVTPGTGTSDIGYEWLTPSFVLTPNFGTAERDVSPSLYGHRIAFAHWTPGNTDADVSVATASMKLASRTSGANRYATAAAISSAYFSKAKNVVLCNGLNFPDALSAAPLAKALNAPLLLTAPGSLPTETLTEITRLGPTKIWVIGGKTVISDAIYTQLDATYDVERIAGADRYATSAAVARKLESLLGATTVFRGFFARGDAFPDALAVGPVAAAANGPVMLVRTNDVPQPIAQAIDDLDITQGYVIGGTTVVSNKVMNDIKALEIANGGLGLIERWAGANRYETATTVADNALRWRWIDLDTVGFAVGTNFPDALGGGAALGHYGSALLLTSGTALSPNTAAFLDKHRYEIGRTDCFGGTTVFTNNVYNAIAAKIY